MDIKELAKQAGAIEVKPHIEFRWTGRDNLILFELKDLEVLLAEHNQQLQLKYDRLNKMASQMDETITSQALTIPKLEAENHDLFTKLHGAKETLAIKAKSLAWWQDQFSSMIGVETKSVADTMTEILDSHKRLEEALEACKHDCHTGEVIGIAKEALAAIPNEYRSE